MGLIAGNCSCWWLLSHTDMNDQANLTIFRKYFHNAGSLGQQAWTVVTMKISISWNMYAM